MKKSHAMLREAARGETAQSDRREARIGFRGNTEAKIRTEHKVRSTVVSVQNEPAVLDVFTPEKDLRVLKEEELCRKRARSVGDLQSCFEYDRHGVLVQKPKLNEALQELVPNQRRRRLLNLDHYPALAGHPERPRMYCTLESEYC